MRPVRCCGVKRNLEEHDHQSIDREEHPVKRSREMKILYEKQRKRTLVLEENSTDEKRCKKKYEQAAIAQHRSTRFAEPSVLGFGVEISRVRCACHRNSDQECAGSKRCESVGEKNRAKGIRRNKSARGGPNTHSEIDGEPYDRECRLALFVGNEISNH